MIWVRTASAIVAIALALSVTSLGGWYFTVLIAAIVLLAQFEYFKLVRATGEAPAARTTLAVSQVLIFMQQFRPEWVSLTLTLGGTLICAYLLLKPKVASINDVATSILGLFYCSYLPSFWISVRSLDDGLKIIFLAYGCIWAADIGAYFAGKAFGKTPLTIVSPKKTVEGAAVGFGGSMAIAVAGAYFLQWPYWQASGLAIGLLVGAAGLIGDLTESLMKRSAGVKDSGDLIPGHGGILDRGDSYVFTAPLVYYFVRLLGV